MKKHFVSSILLFVVLTSFISSCKKEDHGMDDHSGVTTSSIIVTGSWQVSFFQDNGTDHTTNFNGHTFTFNSNGVMTATHDTVVIKGTWRGDDSKNELHFTIGTGMPLSDLNRGWLIVSQNSSEIVLRDDSGLSHEELHFSKI